MTDQQKISEAIEYNRKTKGPRLSLLYEELTYFPLKICQLTHLNDLHLGGPGSNNKIGSLPPEIGQLENLIELTLGGNRVSEIPWEIGQLAELKTLDLGGNLSITNLPASIGNLTKLEILNLSGNKLATLPEEIGSLVYLKKLTLGWVDAGNELEFLPDSIGNLVKLQVLKVCLNRLGDVPPSIFNLSNLQELDLANNKIGKISREIGQLSNLRYLYLAFNELEEIPDTIGGLQKLELLHLEGNRIKVLPKSIGQLQELRELRLGEFSAGNVLTTLPEEIGQLKNLTKLNLSNNNIIGLPQEFCNLDELTELYISHNNLSSLPSSISKLVRLVKLTLNNNKLTTLPAGIKELVNLFELNLGNNQLGYLPSGIGSLSALGNLFLENNRLEHLPDEFASLRKLKQLNLASNQLSGFPGSITGLRLLEKLDISGNKNLRTIPANISRLTRLRELRLRDTGLVELPAEIGELQDLTYLDLSNNSLKRLPREITKLQNLAHLDLTGNSIPIPKELLEQKQRPQLILDYYQEFQDKLLSANQIEAKITVVGQGGVGKTSLVKRLLYDFSPNQEKTTDGIKIDSWYQQFNEQPYHLNIWDFGGQEELYATHQFFLSQGSLYLLVLSARQGETRLEYWLKLITSFGGNSPIIVVINKSDLHRLELNRRGLIEKYPNIYAFVHTSCTENFGIEELRSYIAAVLSDTDKGVLQLSWNTKTQRVKEKLKQLQHDHRTHISHQEFLQICHDAEITGEEVSSLAMKLHMLGIVLNFRDKTWLSDTYILSPEWVTSGVYRILGSVSHSHGILLVKDLQEIFASEAQTLRQTKFILDMMRQFGLCYDVEFSAPDSTYFIPGLLSKEQPENIDFSNSNLNFEYHYEFLPSSVFPRFVVAMHHSIAGDLVWRYGVVLEQGDTRALVRSDEEEKIISIYINGKSKSSKEFLVDIRSPFNRLHTMLNDIEVAEKVRLMDHPDVVIDYKHLLYLESINEKTWIPEGLQQKVNVSELLDGVADKENRETYTLEEASDIKRLIEAHTKRLQKLKEQQAIEGTSCPPKVLIEIEDIEKKLAELKAKLGDSR